MLHIKKPNCCKSKRHQNRNIQKYLVYVELINVASYLNNIYSPEYNKMAKCNYQYIVSINSNYVPTIDYKGFRIFRISTFSPQIYLATFNSVEAAKKAVDILGDKLKIFKKRTKYFLDKDLVHCISSDMHNLKKRPPYMKQAYQIVEKDYGTRRARKLFEENAASLINNEFL